MISLYQDGIAALVLHPAFVIFHPTVAQLLDSLIVLLLLGVVCTALAHTLFIEGMRTLTAQMASVVAALEPVWGILFAVLLLAEIPTFRTLLGGALILGAVLLPSCIPPPRTTPSLTGLATPRRPDAHCEERLRTRNKPGVDSDG